jgi:hypothetical protein
VVLALLGAGSRASLDAEAQPGPFRRPARSIRVSQERIVLQGRWYPIEPKRRGPVQANAVRVVCERAEGTCREELKRVAKETTGEVVEETALYTVDIWTTMRRRAGKLVASRQDGDALVQIRVSLRGNAAVKAVVANGHESRWRLD